MRRYEMRRDGAVLIVGKSRQGRLAAAGTRFLTVFPMVMVALGLLFVIEYIGQPNDPPVAIYAGTVMGFSALIAAASALGRGLRIEFWVFDPVEKVVVLETSNPWGGVVSHGIDFSMIEKVHYDPQAGIVAVVTERSREVVCQGDIREIALAIRDVLDDTRVDFVETPA